MAVQVKDGNGALVTIKTALRGSEHVQITEPPGVSSYINLDLDENGVNVLAAPGQVANAEVFNSHSDPFYVKAYNKASVPDNSDVPIRVWKVDPGGEPFQLDVNNGIDFALGIGFRCTTGRAHADNVGPPTNTCLFNVGYRAT